MGARAEVRRRLGPSQRSGPPRPTSDANGTAHGGMARSARVTARSVIGLAMAIAALPHPAAARDGRRTPPAGEDGRAAPGFDWTGAYLGVNAGVAGSGGRVRGSGAPRGDDERYPPNRTRTRP